MILEAIVIVADWLKDGVYGVNAKIPGVPRYGGHAQPPNVSIYDEVRDPSAARGRIQKDKLPAVIVRLAQPAQLDGEVMTSYRDGDITVSIEYAALKSDPAAGRRDGLYTLRAIQRSLRELERQEAVQTAARLRNGVILGRATSIAVGPLWTPIEDILITAGLAVTFTQTRDTAP